MLISTTKNNINLGNINRGSTTNFEFNLTNNSTRTLNLNVSASCGCTVPTLETKVMLPFSSQTVKGTFKAPSGPGVIHNKNINVSCEVNSLNFKLEGNVL